MHLLIPRTLAAHASPDRHSGEWMHTRVEGWQLEAWIEFVNNLWQKASVSQRDPTGPVRTSPTVALWLARCCRK
jgi:hypothetical protein